MLFGLIIKRLIIKYLQLMKANSDEDIDHILQCYICLFDVTSPMMCPNCSKLACENCLVKWYFEDENETCPYCRKNTKLEEYTKCDRFVSNIKNLKAVQTGKKRKNRMCAEHELEKIYYCTDCRKSVCSDCKILSSKHERHEFVRLSTIQKEKQQTIKQQLARFGEKMQLYEAKGDKIKAQKQNLKSRFDKQKQNVKAYFNKVMGKLDREYKAQLSIIQKKEEANLNEIDNLKGFLTAINDQLSGEQPERFIERCQEIVDIISNFCEKQVEYEREEINFLATNDIYPYFSAFRVVLPNFLEIDEQFVSSDSYEFHGIEWKAKVYPRGIGSLKHPHLSVFLEMDSQFQVRQDFNYIIELANVDCQKSIIREFTREFQNKDSFGYQQFIPLSQIPFGFLNEHEELILEIKVRSTSYKDLLQSKDQQIERLKQKLEENNSSMFRYQTKKMEETY